MHPATSGLLAESYAVGVSDKVEAGMDLELLSAGEPYEVINRLRESLAKLDVADPLLQSFTGLPAMTHAFFPGGNGLYEGVHAVRTPVGGTLVLGAIVG